MHLPCLIVWRAIHSLKHRSKWQSLSGIEEKGFRKKIGKINERRSCFLSCLPPLVLVLAVAELFASLLFPSIVVLSLSNHLLSSLVCWCSAFCHITAACVRAKVHYAIPVLILFVASCTHQTVHQGHQQPIRGAKSEWRRNARALRDDGKTKQNAKPCFRAFTCASSLSLFYSLFSLLSSLFSLLSSLISLSL